jgi:hypothetical protein
MIPKMMLSSPTQPNSESVSEAIENPLVFPFHGRGPAFSGDA